MNKISFFLSENQFVFNKLCIGLTLTYGSLSLPTFRAQNPAQFTKCWHLTVPRVVSTASIWPF